MTYVVSDGPVDEGDSAVEGSGKKKVKPVHVISVVNYCTLRIQIFVSFMQKESPVSGHSTKDLYQGVSIK